VTTRAGATAGGHERWIRRHHLDRGTPTPHIVRAVASMAVAIVRGLVAAVTGHRTDRYVERP